jgi:crotonobetainyl-CoA:carnitine CoA-transferase CaiB-like acyl-CoA transferase
LAGAAVRDWVRSGVVALTGRANGPPLLPPGRGASVANELAADFAQVTGVHVDGARLLSERAAFTGRERRGPVSVGGTCRLLPTLDGWAAVSCARPDDPALLGALTGEHTVADDPWPAVTRWLRAHTGAELAARAELLGVAAAPVERRAAVPRPGTAAAGRSLAGCLVADFSALWAGPLCAHLLGLAGARVVKVETPTRPDGARRGNAEFYRLLHAGHDCVILDPDTPVGRAGMAALVDAADIVIESSRPRALARFGLDAAAAAATGTTWVSITAYGRASDRVGFGDDVAAGAGLVARDPDGCPLFAGDAIADPLTGLTAAVAAAHAPAGGALLDIAMADVVAATLDADSGAAEADSGAAEADSGAAEAALVPVAPPRRRQPHGRAARPGEQTAQVLAELGILS